MPASTAWDSQLLRDPHRVADKRYRVQRMFAAIAPCYDLNNRLHSLWMDQWWRRYAVNAVGLRGGETVVDVACGTGDLAMAFSRRLGRLPGTHRVIGIDFTYEMLPVARAKSPADIVYLNGDAQHLPLPDACADVASIAFGIRNVADPLRALNEFHRILKPGGRLVILEFGLPANPLIRAAYNFYFRRVLPVTATLISGDRTGAYRYLPESVNTFLSPQKLQDLMRDAGFSELHRRPLSLGVCVCHIGLRA